jgi:hypothetical protein
VRTDTKKAQSQKAHEVDVDGGLAGACVSDVDLLAVCMADLNRQRADWLASGAAGGVMRPTAGSNEASRAVHELEGRREPENGRRHRSAVCTPPGLN